MEIPAQYQNRQPETDVDSDNLLNLGHGASVISRSGELNLESSAAHGIDGMSGTSWVSAPGAREEVLVYSLLAPARVLRVGMTAPDEDHHPESVIFEASTDGVRWRDLATLKPDRKSDARQLVDVTTPATAQFIRIRAVSLGRYYLSARAFHILGEEIAPPRTPPFTGCWTVNGVPMHLTQDRARITGVMETDPPTYIDGGTDNRVGLAMWIQGPTWGYVALTRSPDGRHLTGFRFYEEVDSQNVGDGLFGERCGAVIPSGVEGPGRAGRQDPPAPHTQVPRLTLGMTGAAQDLLRHAGHYTVFGLVFDAREQLVEELSAPAIDDAARLLASSPQARFRIVSREFRRGSAELNARHSATRLSAFRNALQARGVDTSRIELVAAGDQWIGPPVGSTMQAKLASRIDIEAVR